MPILQRLTICLTFIVVSILATLFINISFDGALNLQSALNYVENGHFVQNYGKQVWVQTHLPFQAINGYLVNWLGLTPIAIHSANILFALLLFTLFAAILSDTKSWVTVAALVWLFTNKLILNNSFAGLGDLPAWTLLLTGIYLLLIKNHLLLSGILIGLAFSTKWLTWITLPLILYPLYKNYSWKNCSRLLFSSTLTILLVWWAEYQQIFQQLGQQFGRIIRQGLPEDLESNFSSEPLNLSSYIDRIKAHLDLFNEYQIWFCLVITLMVFLLSRYLLKKSEHPQKYQYYLFLKFLLCGTVIIIIWYLFLSSRMWPRRFYAVPLFSMLSLSILPVFFTKKYLQSRLFDGLTIVLILISFATVHTKLNTERNNLSLFQTIKDQINLQPADSQYYMFGFWQAPFWSLQLNAPLKDLFYQSFSSTKYISGQNNYLLLEPDSKSFNDFQNLILSRYQLEFLPLSEGYQMVRITGLVPEEITADNYFPKKYNLTAYAYGKVTNNERRFSLPASSQERYIELTISPSKCFDGLIYAEVGNKQSAFQTRDTSVIKLQIPPEISEFTIWHDPAVRCRYGQEETLTYHQIRHSAKMDER